MKPMDQWNCTKYGRRTMEKEKSGTLQGRKYKNSEAGKHRYVKG